MKLFKIRSSAASKIMGNVNRPTEKQLIELDKLLEKSKAGKITEKQKEMMDSIIAKRDAKPELSVGAKTYCKQWLKEQPEFYNRTADFANKYTDKGEECEPDGIRLVADKMGYGEVFKNAEQFEDADITGTPDLIVKESVDDIKCSWSWETFPLFEDELPTDDYYYQLQCYMALTGRRKGSVNYCLIDTPMNLIEREAKNKSFRAGYVELENELFEEAFEKMTYTNVPDSLRVKRFEITYDEAVIAQIRTQVALCREYINTLVEKHQPPPSISLASSIPEGGILG